MAGVSFSFFDFKSLLELSIGISKRLDENRSESFTILYCDFKKFEQELVTENLYSLLRNSDSFVHCEYNYFIIMHHTDRYGANAVHRMIEEIFAEKITSETVCYPADGETPEELLEKLHSNIHQKQNQSLDCLYNAIAKKPIS